MSEGKITSKDYHAFLQSNLPDCEAHQLLQMVRVQQTHQPKLTWRRISLLKELSVPKTGLEQVLEANDELGVLDEEEDLQRALTLKLSKN